MPDTPELRKTFVRWDRLLVLAAIAVGGGALQVTGMTLGETIWSRGNWNLQRVMITTTAAAVIGIAAIPLVIAALHSKRLVPGIAVLYLPMLAEAIGSAWEGHDDHGWFVSYPVFWASSLVALIVLPEVGHKPPAETCADCGYDLRVTTSGTCPECGLDDASGPGRIRFRDVWRKRLAWWAAAAVVTITIQCILMSGIRSLG